LSKPSTTAKYSASLFVFLPTFAENFNCTEPSESYIINPIPAFTGSCCLLKSQAPSVKREKV